MNNKPIKMCTLPLKHRRTARPAPVDNPFELMLPISSMWDIGSEIKITFLSGTKLIRDHVKEIASEWLAHANLNFVYVKKTEQSDIRITFNTKLDSSSAVGTENLDYGPNEPTMNFGWLNEDTSEIDFRSVVLHEFGHMIGCGHEHESPKNGGVPWDTDKAYAHYKKTQGWKPKDVDAQIFGAYEHDEIRGSKLDKKSIMMYPIPESITKGNFMVRWNSRLSKGDKEFIRKIYPF